MICCCFPYLLNVQFWSFRQGLFRRVIRLKCSFIWIQSLGLFYQKISRLITVFNLHSLWLWLQLHLSSLHTLSFKAQFLALPLWPFLLLPAIEKWCRHSWHFHRWEWILKMDSSEWKKELSLLALTRKLSCSTHRIFTGLKVWTRAPF